MMDFTDVLEYVFFPGRRAARKRVERLLSTIEEEHCVDLRGARDGAGLAAEVAAETGTPLPRDILSVLRPDIGRHLPRPPGYASWGLLVALGLAAALVTCGACPRSAPHADPRPAPSWVAGCERLRSYLESHPESPR